MLSQSTHALVRRLGGPAIGRLATLLSPPVECHGVQIVSTEEPNLDTSG